MEVKNTQLIAAIELYKSAENDSVREQAIGIMEAMAQAGDVTACLILGVNYDPTKEKGFTRRDEAKALEWYEKAAELGEAKGANEAAILYFRGSEELRDKEKAEKYIRMAVDMAPDNEVYKKNFDVIVEKPKPVPVPDPAPEDAADDCGEDKAEKDGDDGEDDDPADEYRGDEDNDPQAMELPIISSERGSLMIFDLVCGVVIAALAVLYFVWKLDYYYLAGIIALLIAAGVFNWRMLGCSVSVTTRRVTGRRSFQRMIDVPLDTVTSVGTCSFGGVSVTAASSRSAFYLIKNADDIRSAVASQLVDRQNRAAKPTVIIRDTRCSYADELTKLSELVDSGFVTQDEFEELKDEIIHT